MDIIFYNTSSERNAINKTLQGGFTLQGTFRDECPISDPEFIVESDTNFTQYNYVYIAEFKRYYYITEVVSVRTKIWRISLHVDVLMSFKNAIMTSKILIEESQVTSASNYLNSDSWVAQVRRNTEAISFENGFLDQGQYILITAGGV